MANIYFSLSNEKLLTFLTADDNRKHHDQEKSNNALENFKENFLKKNSKFRELESDSPSDSLEKWTRDEKNDKSQK